MRKQVTKPREEIESGGEWQTGVGVAEGERNGQTETGKTEVMASAASD